MPWYRINGMTVHLHGRKLPAPCAATIRINGNPARCCAISSLLCDWPMGEGRTCDAPLCADCGWEVAPDQHLCPPHHLAHSMQGTGGLFTSLMETE